MVIGLLALTSSAAFFGTAFYVLFVEHVARESLDDRGALTEWQPSYKRGAVMQALIALVSGGLGALSWWRLADPWFGIGAILVLLPWPWTLIVIKPTNDTLLATSPDQAGAETRKLLRRWGRLHAVRMVLGGAATLAFLIGLMRSLT